MQRFKNLNFIQKIIIISMIVMPLIFAMVYQKTLSTVGFEYKDEIFVPSQVAKGTVYSGKINDTESKFVVSNDNSVFFSYGSTSFGPYTVKNAKAAIPKDSPISAEMSGVEIYNEDQLMFRGGVANLDGEYYFDDLGNSLSNGEVGHVNGKDQKSEATGTDDSDTVKPTASTIYQLLNEPELTHKGDAAPWFIATFLCIFNIFFILFANEIFRWRLSLQVRNVDVVEASDLEISSRYVYWLFLPVLAMFIFVIGLG